MLFTDACVRDIGIIKRRLDRNLSQLLLDGSEVLPIRVKLDSISDNHQRANIQTDIQGHFQMVTGFNEVVTLMVNAETGMSGYLLTKSNEFLQPYTTALRKLPSCNVKPADFG